MTRYQAHRPGPRDAALKVASDFVWSVVALVTISAFFLVALPVLAEALR